MISNSYKFIILFILLIFGLTESRAQVSYTRQSGTITFFSTAPLEDIKATNTSFESQLEPEKGIVTFTVPISGFIFRKTLMQQHFNEQYMESEMFPAARFTGRFDKIPLIIPQQDTTIRARVTGNLTIKGIARQINEEVVLEKKDSLLTGFCKFNVRLADYEIKIPKVFVKNIAEVVEVTISIVYKELKENEN